MAIKLKSTTVIKMLFTLNRLYIAYIIEWCCTQRAAATAAAAAVRVSAYGKKDMDKKWAGMLIL